MIRQLLWIVLPMLSLATMTYAQAEDFEPVETPRLNHIVQIVKKLQYPTSFGAAQLLYDELEAADRSQKNLKPIWPDLSPVEQERRVNKIISSAMSLLPGPVGIVSVEALRSKTDEGINMARWQYGCGRSIECTTWTAVKYESLYYNRKQTTDIKGLAETLKIDEPDNSEVTSGDRLELIPILEGLESKEYFGFTPSPEPPGKRKENLLEEAEEYFGHPISKKSFERKINDLPKVTEEEKKHKEFSPLQKMQQRHEARIQRAIRTDIYRSIGKIITPLDPELGKIAAVGFPAVERLTAGFLDLASAGFSMVAFGDVLGGAAALISLFAESGPDPIYTEISAIQKGLGTVSKQIGAVDKKVNHIMKQLDDMAMMQVKTSQQLEDMAKSLENMHSEVLREINRQSNLIGQLAIYLLAQEKDDVLDKLRVVEDCSNVHVESRQTGEDNDIQKADFRNCRQKAYSLSSDVASRSISTGASLPNDLTGYLDKKFTHEQAFWIAARWRNAAITVIDARKKALEIPQNYRGIFEKEDGTSKGIPEVTINKVFFNPKIWSDGVELYVKLERERSQDIAANDNHIDGLLESGEHMQKLLNMFDNENLAYDAMELHLFNGHLFVQTLKGLWTEYMSEKRDEISDDKKNRKNFKEFFGQLQSVGYWDFNWLFEYWLNDYDETYVPIDNPEKLRSVFLIATAHEDVTTEFEMKSSPQADYGVSEFQIHLYEGGNIVYGPKSKILKVFPSPFSRKEVKFPAIFGKFSASWKGCFEVELKYFVKGHEPFGKETKKICVIEDADKADLEFEMGGPLVFDVGKRGPLEHCALGLGELHIMSLDEEPMFRTTGALAGKVIAKVLIRKGSLVLNQTGLSLGWDEPDPYHSEESGIMKDAYRIISHGPENCKFYMLSGMPEEKPFFSDRLKIAWGFAKDPKFRTADTKNGGEVNKKKEESELREEGPTLLFEPTERNEEFLKNNLAELIFNQKVKKIFENAKRKMRNSDSQMVPNFKELEYATQVMMREFGIWATDDANITKKVKLYLDEVVGFPYLSMEFSLKEVLSRLNKSWEAVQILSRIASGSCSFTPGGTSFSALASNLASGDDVKKFLKDDFDSWRELRELGLLGVSRKGLRESAYMLRERIGALDGRWPLLNEISVLTYDGGMILLASVDAAMDLVRFAAREHAPESTVKSDTTITRRNFEAEFAKRLITIHEDINGSKKIYFTNMSKWNLWLREFLDSTPPWSDRYTSLQPESLLSDREIEELLRTPARTPASTQESLVLKLLEFEELALSELFPFTPSALSELFPFITQNCQNCFFRSGGTVSKILGAGVPIAWVHKDEEISVIDFVIRKLFNVDTLSEDLNSENSPELVRSTEADNLRSLVQNTVLDILERPLCRPGISEFEDGIKLLKSIRR